MHKGVERSEPAVQKPHSGRASRHHFRAPAGDVGLPWEHSDKEPAKAGDTGSIPGAGRPLEKETATHSSVLALRIPWTEPPGGLQPTGLPGARQDRATLPAVAARQSCWLYRSFLLRSKVIACCTHVSRLFWVSFP